MTTKEVTPIHLTGANCGDGVFYGGKRIGLIHRWTKNGCAVTLDQPFAVESPFGQQLTDTIIVTDYDFSVGRFGWEKA